jgi:hypothetical protein
MGGSKPKKKSSKSRSKKKSSKRFKSMNIRRMSGADNPQFSISHEQHPGEDGTTAAPEEHGAADEQDLMSHVQQHAPNLGPPEPQEPMPQMA